MKPSELFSMFVFAILGSLSLALFHTWALLTIWGMFAGDLFVPTFAQGLGIVMVAHYLKTLTDEEDATWEKLVKKFFGNLFLGGVYLFNAWLLSKILF